MKRVDSNSSLDLHRLPRCPFVGNLGIDLPSDRLEGGMVYAMDLETLADSLKQYQISEQSEAPEEIPPETILDLDYKQKIHKWPKLQLSKIPAIFLHKPAKLDDHVQKILSMRIKFYQPTLGQNNTKISCVSHNDHKSLIKYFEKKNLPYHTHGNPAKRKMKVVIRGLPPDTNPDKVKAELKSLAVPENWHHALYKGKDDDSE
ncbi:Gag-like protein [Operophtera brumata]|uniref:Gag-like protein n=1 Tax=Operophtera brumata TaxID=104452 RepID=A0A0L7LKU4_OPEBR|nr:Gag-like protein [Operophtera brumata]